MQIRRQRTRTNHPARSAHVRLALAVWPWREGMWTQNGRGTCHRQPRSCACGGRREHLVIEPRHVPGGDADRPGGTRSRRHVRIRCLEEEGCIFGRDATPADSRGDAGWLGSNVRVRGGIWKAGLLWNLHIRVIVDCRPPAPRDRDRRCGGNRLFGTRFSSASWPDKRCWSMHPSRRTTGS